ncbi:MAG TPA: arsenosugar biosynthesis radical SAM (seleno)protein ArsS, partial [Candidatus Binataceae bacterium]|nr:arsenosugar biosynthesis radical SAM (seleno)protein ArsS [Candidatus Binataceae bacterium]
DLAIERRGLKPPRRSEPDTLQINVGKLCNQACHHCHVDAGPKRTEIMTRATAERVVRLMLASPGLHTVDITGGAPELNSNFASLVESAREADRAVIVRCNLTIIFASGMEWLPRFYRDNRVRLICSLPCYTAENVEKQRGRGVFEKSIEALLILNRLGFGDDLALDLVYNPVGPSLPPAQAQLEEQYRERLKAEYGIKFNRLLTIANMPISRFARQLEACGKFAEYMSLLVAHFNPATIDGLMCRNIVSVGYDVRLYDCDFNQMLAIPIGAGGGADLTIWDIDCAEGLRGAPIATGAHCFGCTAGAGSSCGGALSHK